MINVHQIWIGGDLPEHDREDVDDLVVKLSNAGHSHKLWSYGELMETVEDDELVKAVERARELLPHTMFASMLTDYFRVKLLETPGLYMDTDVVCVPDEFPDMPSGSDIYTCTNSDGKTMNTCILYVPTEKGAAGCAKVAGMVADKLKLVFLGEDAERVTDNLKAEPYSLMTFVGPGFFKAASSGTLKADGVRVVTMPLIFARSKNSDTVLLHRGSGKWCFGGKGNHHYRYKSVEADKGVKPTVVWGGVQKSHYGL